MVATFSRYAMKQIRKCGRLAFLNGEDITDNPYREGTESARLWEVGYKEAEGEHHAKLRGL